MTRKQKILAKIRAWIDRQLPRDVLRITIHAIDSDSNRRLHVPLFSSTHMETILRCKMGSGMEALHFKGELLVTFSTEHLSV